VAGAFLLLIVVVGSLAVFEILRQKELEEEIQGLADRMNRVHILTEATGWLLAEVQYGLTVSYADFRAHGFSLAIEKHIAQADNKVSDAMVNLNQLQGLVQAQDRRPIHAALAGIQKLQELFITMITLQEKKGNENLGLQGKWGSKIIKVEDLLKKVGPAELQMDVLMMRRHEKDYQMRGSEVDAARVHDLGTGFKRKAEASHLAPASKQSLVAWMDEYLNVFSEGIAVDAKLLAVLQAFDAQARQINDLFLQIEHLAQGGVQLAAEKRKRAEEEAMVYTAGTIALAIILALLVTVLAAAGFNRQVSRVMKVFSDIGIGDFSTRAEVVSQDEIGQIAEALNAMLDNTLTLIQTREERDTIQASIMKLLNEISELQNGDLTARAEVTEEVTGAIADSFNSMAEQLSTIVQDVKQATREVSTTANQVHGTTRELAQTSSQQAQRTSDAVEKINQMVAWLLRMAEEALRSAKVSEQSMRTAKDGAEVVQKTNQSMESIRERVQETARAIKRLGESSQEIGHIVQIINELADRTSILALNASIQAAAAGDAGRGFAVVATEVQRLAERSGSSTKQIEVLVNNIQGEINNAGARMEESIQRVVDGSRLADDAHAKLQEIEKVSSQLAKMIHGIAVSSGKSAKASEMIARAMQAVSKTSAQASDVSRQTAASMQAMTRVTEKLRISVEAFKLDDAADQASAPLAAPSSAKSAPRGGISPAVPVESRRIPPRNAPAGPLAVPSV
jgi:twitching motility protein PilJ